MWILFVLFAVAYSQECGKKPPQRPWDQRIVAGRDADRGAWPWQISLQFSRDASLVNFGHTCGATLIDPHWAITAGHCVDPFFGGENRTHPHFYRLGIGAHNISDPGNDGPVINGQIDMIIPHPKYTGAPLLGYPNDIAMLRIPLAVDLTDPRVGLACLPTVADYNFTNNPDCWISGWGKANFSDAGIPQILQEANVRIPSNDECDESHIGTIRDTHICAGDGLPNACSGDSGGPMSCFKDGTWWLAGSTSYGVIGCEDMATIYTRMSKYWEWIALTMSDYPLP